MRTPLSTSIVKNKKILMYVCCFILLSAVCPRQSMAITPNGLDNYFQIDGDYGIAGNEETGSILANVHDPLDLGYLEKDVNDGMAPDRHTTYGRTNGEGFDWAHITSYSINSNTYYPYMGKQAYLAECLDHPTNDGINDRSEQGLLAGAAWSYSPTDNGERYFTAAIFVPSDMSLPPYGDPYNQHFFFVQWHQGGDNTAPLRLTWDRENDEFAFGGYWDEKVNGVYARHFNEYIFQPSVPVTRNVWHYFFFRAKFGRGDGDVFVQKMNNATGQWDELCHYTNQNLGFQYNYTTHELLTDTNYQWKIGTYKGAPNTWSKIVYDNVSYGRLWNYITKNRLIGYHKTVCDLWFEESGTTTAAADSCWWDNGGSQGDAVTDYNNDGELRNFNFNSSSGWKSGGVIGNCLKFDGVNDHVRVPLDIADFDFGNYLTLGCWFKTTDSTNVGKALISQDYHVTSTDTNAWKARLYFNANNKVDFCIRHPDGTTSQVRYYAPSSVFDGTWHYVVGTYNRFASDGQRLKIYFDGDYGNQNSGADKPVLRGNTYLYVGKIFNSGYYKGYIDEVMVRNYETTDSEVSDLYNWYINY